MEILLELFLTVSLSIIFTSLFIKLFSMHPNNTDENPFPEETLEFDKFQWMPLNEEMIKLEKSQNEGNSSVEFNNFVGVEKEDEVFPMQPINTANDHFKEEATKVDKFQWMPLKEEVIKFEKTQDEGKSLVELHKIIRVEKEEKFRDVVVLEENDDHEETCSVGSEFGEERKLCEIEIEGVEEGEGKSGVEEGENVIDDDWEQIEKKDFEELLGKGGLCVDVA